MYDIDYGEVFDVAAESEIEVETNAEAAEEVTEEIGQEEERESKAEENRQEIAKVRQRAEADGRLKAHKEVDTLLAGAGLTDPYTQKPISNLSELNEFKGRQFKEKRREFQEGHGMSDEEYGAFVDSLPEVRAARAAAERAAADSARAKLEQDISEVRRLDPDIGSLEDLAQREEYSKLCGFVEKGLSLPEAFKLVYFDSLAEKTARASKQAAMNLVNGKNHLKQTDTRGNGAAAVPAEIAAEYRVFMPEASDAEIQKHYDEYVKTKTGGR